MFNLYLNDLSEIFRQFGKGIVFENDTISHLLYADDLVLLADNEHDLQFLLDKLSIRCIQNKTTINANKTKVMHFRCQAMPRTDFEF